MQVGNEVQVSELKSEIVALRAEEEAMNVQLQKLENDVKDMVKDPENVKHAWIGTTLPLQCVFTAFVAKTVPFFAVIRLR